MIARILLVWGTLIAMGLGAASLGLAAPVLVRSAIGGGGRSTTASGNVKVQTMIGQPIAASAAGVSFSLSGGFWFALAPTDCNQDGAANLFDHQALTQCLAGPGAAAAGACRCFDVNDSGRVDLMDFASAQNIFAPG